MPNKNKYSKKELLDIIHKYINKFDNVKKGGAKRVREECMECVQEDRTNRKCSRRLKNGDTILTVDVSSLSPCHVKLTGDNWYDEKITFIEDTNKKPNDLNFTEVIFAGYVAALASIISITNVTPADLYKYKQFNISDEVCDIVYTLNSGNYVITKIDGLIIYKRFDVSFDTKINKIVSGIKDIVESKCSTIERTEAVELEREKKAKAEVKKTEFRTQMNEVLNYSYKKVKELHSIIVNDTTYNVPELISQLEELTKLLKKIVKHKSIIHEISNERLYNIINDCDNDDEYKVEICNKDLTDMLINLNIKEVNNSEDSSSDTTSDTQSNIDDQL